MAQFQIPQILIDFENTQDEEEFENCEHEIKEEEEEEELHNDGTPKKNKFLLNIKKYSRPRARSIDVGRVLFSSSPGVVHDEKDYLKIDEGDLANRLKKKKTKNKLFNKFQNLIKKGSASSSGTTSPTPYKGRNRAYSIDFSNNTPSSLISLSPILAQAMAEESCESKSKMSRTGSLAGTPIGTFEHKVGAEETLASIAAKHRSTTGELKLINRLMNDMVFPEQVLHIPEEPLSASRRRIKSECVSFEEPESPYKLGRVTEENQYHYDGDGGNGGDGGDAGDGGYGGDGGDGDDFRGGRKGGEGNDGGVSDSGDYGGGSGNGKNKTVKEKGGRRNSMGVIFGFGMKNNENQDKFYHYDNIESKKDKSKKKNSKHHDNKTKNNNNNNKNNNSNNNKSICTKILPQPKSNVFSATLHYITGAENVAGLLAITVSDVRFEPFKNTDHLTPGGKEGLNAIYDLIKHRMSVAKLLYSACLMNECPVRTKILGEKDEEPLPEVSSVKNFKYLCLKLRKKKNVRSSQTPFLEALIKNVLPGPRYYEHYFIIPTEITQEFETFMCYYYFDNYNRQEDEDVDFAPTLPDVHDIQSKRETFRRTLSLAELCNLALPEMSEESHVFTDGHIRVFREFLPPKVDGRPWELGYSSWKHGFSLQTMYRCLDKQTSDGVALLIVEDTSHHVFGALISGGGVKRSEGFYGTGESFLFTFYNFFQKFSWTGANECVAKGSLELFVVGASDSKFGLYVDNNLERGFSYACKTFNNEPLTNDTTFQIHTLEVWLFPMELSS